MSQGVGGDLAALRAGQRRGEPQIPLGGTGAGALAAAPGEGALPWQVVGYAERCEVDTGDDEQSRFWREYLLYHRTEGFAFLVDAEDGWSWCARSPACPNVRGEGGNTRAGSTASCYDYRAKVTYVLGEFYWRRERDATTNTDYIGTGARSRRGVNRERTGSGILEGVVGRRDIDAVVVAQGLRLGAEAWRR